MLKSVETWAWGQYKDDKLSVYRDLFNTKDTYISILGRYQHADWERLVDNLSKYGFEVKVLFDDKAINHYISHQDEYFDTNPSRLVQRLVIYEFDKVPG